MTTNMLLLVLAAAGGVAAIILVIGIAAWALMGAKRSSGSPAGWTSPKEEAAVSIIAALFVLFSAMLSPLVAAGMAVAFLLAVGIYKALPQR